MPVMKVQPSTITLMAELLKQIEKVEEQQKQRLDQDMEVFNERLRLLDPNDSRMTVAMIETSRDIQNSIVMDQKICDQMAQISTKCKTAIVSLSKLIKSMPLPVQAVPPTNNKIKKRKSEVEATVLKRTKSDEIQEAVLVIDEDTNEAAPGPGPST